MSTAVIACLFISTSGCGGAIPDGDTFSIKEKSSTDSNAPNSVSTQMPEQINAGSEATSIFVKEASVDSNLNNTAESSAQPNEPSSEPLKIAYTPLTQNDANNPPLSETQLAKPPATQAAQPQAQGTGSTDRLLNQVSPIITGTSSGTQNQVTPGPVTPPTVAGATVQSEYTKEALADDLFPKPKGFGVEKFNVTCTDNLTGTHWVTFGLPFPRGELDSSTKIRVERIDGTEIAADASDLAYWRHFKDSAKDGKWIRSALVVFRHDCTNAKTAEYRFRWGSTRTMHAASSINSQNVTTTWGNQAPPMPHEHAATDNYQRDSLAKPILEPKVWVTLPSHWLAASNIRGPSNPLALPDIKKYKIEYAKTYVNDVATDVLSYEVGDNGAGLIDWNIEKEGWLYDRPLALSDVYVATGELKWLKHMHRAAQYYASWIAIDSSNPPNSRGAFVKVNGNDSKYSLNGGLFSAYLLSGDTRLLEKISAVADLHLGNFNTRLPPYSKTHGLWTERHLASTINGLIYGYEATGSAKYKNRVIEILNGMVSDVKTPPSGYPSAAQMSGILFHRMEVHEGNWWREGPDLFMSPWMSALLAESLWRYFMLSDDSVSLEFLSDYGKFVAEQAIYSGKLEDPFNGKAHAVFSVPYYGLGLIYKGRADIWTDREHALDVAGLIARGRWASKKLGRSTAIYDVSVPLLFRTGMANFGHWTRPTLNLPRSRLSPTRKFALWFGSTHDFSWFSPDGK